MSSISPYRENELDAVRECRAELDRKVFFLKTLFEASRELGGFIQPKKIMDVFLLTTMGSLGAAHGLVLLINVKSQKGHLVHRGIPDGSAREIEENIPFIYDQFFLKGRLAVPAAPWVSTIGPDSLPLHSPFPGGTEALLLWAINEEYCGLVALGGRISEEPFVQDDFDFMSNLTNILIGALSHAVFTKNIQQLNADLERKNVLLQEAFDQAQQVGRELDKRVFHLKTLYELTVELSPTTDLGELLETFLLMTMGTFGVSVGFGLLYDRRAGSVRSTCRGTGSSPEIDAEAADNLFYACFDAAEKRSLNPMSVTRLNQPEHLFSEHLFKEHQFKEHQFDHGFSTAMMLVVDHSFMGLIGLGPHLDGEPLSMEEEELLAAQASNFMVFLKNGRSFEVIQDLNRDLQESNEALKQTIVDLTECRYKITVLEKARGHLKALFQKESERIGRASRLDFVLILITAAFLAVLFNYSNPHGISILPETLFHSPVPRVDAAAARQMVRSGKAVIVDARPRELYDREHIEGAVNVPASLFDIIYKMKLARMLVSGGSAIVYGRTISKRYDEEVAYRLMRRDHEQVMVLSGGLGAWEEKGYPVAR